MELVLGDSGSLLLLYPKMEAASYWEGRQICTNIHGFIFQKTGSSISTTVRNSNLGS